ncbi:hypothetical protein [Rossellomorea marisflavi]|uniref:hypothetical protein n=1 Tax=Rossellomorea marisflavi TaxID=189381 RepID=UPI0009A6C94E|nr:hypothetical protein [Rossellomorea marisflavi]
MNTLLGIILLPITLAVLALLGYFFGVILAITPLIGSLLDFGFISTPTMLAWVFVGAFTLGLFNRKGGE